MVLNPEELDRDDHQHPPNDDDDNLHDLDQSEDEDVETDREIMDANQNDQHQQHNPQGQTGSATPKRTIQNQKNQNKTYNKSLENSKQIPKEGQPLIPRDLTSSSRTNKHTKKSQPENNSKEGQPLTSRQLSSSLQTKPKAAKKPPKENNSKEGKPFSKDQIEKLLEYSLYQGNPIYKVKFQGEPQTSWQDGNRIPKELKDHYHSLYNAKGKKRKRPQKKKYFDSQQVQALASTSGSKQTIMAAFIDRKGTLIKFLPSAHDGLWHDNINYKSASDIPSHLFKSFFDRLDQEIKICKSGKGLKKHESNGNKSQYFPVSTVRFPPLVETTKFVHHLTPHKARYLPTHYSSPEGILAFKNKLRDHVKLFHTSANF